jgi:hypothetical protein
VAPSVVKYSADEIRNKKENNKMKANETIRAFLLRGEKEERFLISDIAAIWLF